jgi:hypothetical protein
LTEKRNHTWCELGHDSSSGVKEGGTSLLDLDSGDRMHKKKQIILALNHRIHTTHNNIFINAKKKNQPKYTKCSNSHMLKKKKTEIDRKKIIPGVSWDTIRVRV